MRELEQVKQHLKKPGDDTKINGITGMAADALWVWDACDQVRDLVVVLNTDGIIVFCNDRFAQATNSRKADLVGRNLLALPLPLRTRDEWHYLIDSVVGLQAPMTVVTHGFTDGENRIYETTARPTNCDRRYVLCTCTDTTELRALTAELELHQKMVEGFHGIAYRGDFEFSNLSLNGMVEAITGYTPDELVKRKMTWDELVHPADRHVIEGANHELATLQRPVTHCEYRLLRKDGSTRWVHSITNVICDHTGTPTSVQGVLYDITDYVHHRERTCHFHAVLDSIRDIVIVTTKSGNILEANQAAVTTYGYELEQLTSLNIAALCQESTDHRSICEDIANGHPFEMTHIKKDGTRFPVEVSSRFTTLEGRNVLVSVIRDISRRKAALGEITRLRDKDQVTGVYSRHYLKMTSRALQAEGLTPVSILVLDVNGLKQVNDRLGIEAGDQLLTKVGHCIQDVVGDKGIVGRSDGDEFGVILPNIDSVTANQMAQLIRKAVTESLGTSVSIAIGVATRQSVDDNLYETRKKAEERMLFNKLSSTESILNSIISSLSASLYEKSNETEVHTTRLQHYARLVGQRLGLNQNESDELNLLAKLHDIGKIGVPETILNKPERLTPEEWQIMKQHPEIGYRIARTVSALSPIAGSILSHHERWDGTGYPSELSGRDIPVLARIISIVDAYDVMVSGRPYQLPKTQAEALQELENQSGRQFDPTLVKIFKEAIQKEQLV